MNNMDRDQVIINKVNIDRLIKDVEDLQDMLQVHVDSDASEHFDVSSKLARIAFDLATLKEQMSSHSSQLSLLGSQINKLNNLKVSAVAWLTGAGAVVWIIWTVISKYIG